MSHSTEQLHVQTLKKKKAFSLINDSEVVDLGEELGQKAEGGEE